MEVRKLPNATISLVLGIISFIACCLTSGIGGVVLSGIALYLANKDKKTYELNPEMYDNYSQVKTARIVAIIGLVLAIIMVIALIIGLIVLGGVEGYEEWLREIQEQQAAGGEF